MIDIETILATIRKGDERLLDDIQRLSAADLERIYPHLEELQNKQNEVLAEIEKCPFKDVRFGESNSETSAFRTALKRAWLDLNGGAA